MLLSPTGSFFTGGERFISHEGGNQLMLQGCRLAPSLFHMTLGRTPAGILNACFSILKKLMNTASMAKHFNQPQPAVSTIKKKNYPFILNQAYQKFLRRMQVILGGRNKKEGQRCLTPKDVQWPLCLLNKLSTFWFFTCWSSSSAYGPEVKNKEICIHYHT